jgi:hypothetical protein
MILPLPPSIPGPNSKHTKPLLDAFSLLTVALNRFLGCVDRGIHHALLGQMARDSTPENVYEYGVAKTFGCL